MSYGYDAARRLTSVTSAAGGFTYQYTGSHSLVSGVSLPNGAFYNYSYDSVGRLLSTYFFNSDSSQAFDEHFYLYDLAGQRTNHIQADDFNAYSSLDYTYDKIGQLKTSTGKEYSGATRWHEQMGYAYDAAGNLNYRTNNGLIQSFAVNSLNELTSVGRSGTLTVAGTTTSPATNVTVNSLVADRYGDNTFSRTNLSLADGNNT